MSERAQRFTYRELQISARHLIATYQLDEETFTEEIEFEGVGDLTQPAPRALAQLWFLLAGLSYYKAGAAEVIDVGTTPVGPLGRGLLHDAIRNGLAEFAYRNELPLDAVEVIGGTALSPTTYQGDPHQVITPFGGGIDSIVTVESLRTHVEQTLFIVSPSSGRFTPLENTAQVSQLPIVRATRRIDEQILARAPHHFQGHVPVTAMVTLLAAVAAVASGRGGVAMSNEHSASAPNLEWRGIEVNHQWSKSWQAEQLIAAAIAESIGESLSVASYLRDRSELWVARELARYPHYLSTFRSCNRAFHQQASERATSWCGTCDKCLFIHLVLAPFIPRPTLRDVMGVEPLANPDLVEPLRALLAIGEDHKPFECVGDPDESAVALHHVAGDPAWRDVPHLATIAREVGPDRTLVELLEPQGGSDVPAHWH
jgi:UDP-N-acetyl-alpha-D-muramoyl-L-alanyl-L-glutamate epimerase